MFVKLTGMYLCPCLCWQVAFVADRRPMSPAWVHDFASTDKYAIIVEHPLYMQLGSLLLNTPATHIFSEFATPGEHSAGLGVAVS